MKKRKWTKRAGRRAGRPNYSRKWLKYPYYMPPTSEGISNPSVGLWHMKRVLMWRLGYISINGKRCDDWKTYTPEKIAYFHKLIDWATDRLKIQEEKYNEEVRNGILKDIFDQTDAIVEKHKQCLNSNEIGDIGMAKLSYNQMMDWASKVKDFEGGTNWLKLPQGIHCMRVVPDGADNDPFYFRHFIQHDCGKDSAFRSWLCWDYVMDNKQVREYFEEKEILTEADAEKYSKYGDPTCATLDVIKKYVKNLEPIYDSLRTRGKCILNVFYLFQAYPADKTEKTPKTGLHVWEISPAMNKKIINALGKDAATDFERDVDENDLAELLSVDNGKLLSVQAEGEGIGKNKREYTIDLKGKRGPIIFTEDGSNPYKAENKNKRLTLPDDFEVYTLLDIEASKFLSYQETINAIKSIPLINKTLEGIGYTIPGDEPSDNPLDDNYDRNYAKRTVGKPIKTIKEDSPLRQAEKKKKEKWEDEEEIAKDKKKIQSKKIVEVEEDEDIFDEDEEIEVAPKKNSFEKKVPPSDPEKEVITNASKGSKPGKRKIF